MNDYLSPTVLRDFGAATTAVVAVTNLALMLGGDKVRQYAKFVALFMALVIVFAAQGVPASFAAGLSMCLSAVYLFLAAMGGNTAIADGLTLRQSTERGLTLPEARYWRKW